MHSPSGRDFVRGMLRPIVLAFGAMGSVRSPYCAQPFCVCIIESGTCQAVERENKYFRALWPRHLTTERLEGSILAMSNLTLLRPSQLKIGTRVGTKHEFYYFLLSEPAEQPDGSIQAQVQYADGGRSIRVWDLDNPTVPVVTDDH